MQARVAAVNEGAILADDAKWAVIEKQLTYPPLWLINHWLIDDRKSLDWSEHYHEIVESGRMLLVAKSKTIPDAIGVDFQKLYEWIGSTGGTRNAVPQHQAHTPHRPAPETVEQKAARTKRERVADWQRTITKIATFFFETDKTSELAFDYAIHTNSPQNRNVRLDRRFTSHREALLAEEIVKWTRQRLIGLLQRCLDRYKSPETRVPFSLNRSTEWQADKNYRAGDYEKWGGVTYWCLKNHTASGTNTPGVDTTFWQPVYLDNIPSTFTYDVISYDGLRRQLTPKSVTINIETGAGILDLIHCIAQEFGYTDDLPADQQPPEMLHESEYRTHGTPRYFYGVIEKVSVWKDKMDAYELWTGKPELPTAIVPGGKIYQARVAHQRKSQERDALSQTKADWLNLAENYHRALKTPIPIDSQSPWHR